MCSQSWGTFIRYAWGMKFFLDKFLQILFLRVLCEQILAIMDNFRHSFSSLVDFDWYTNVIFLVTHTQKTPISKTTFSFEWSVYFNKQQYPFKAVCSCS